MPAIFAYAPGKIILIGEHAVVYGRPAIAVPVEQVRARAMVWANPRLPSNSIQIKAPDVGLNAWLSEMPADHPIALAIKYVLDALAIDHSPAFSLQITSSIPIAAGLGSGAAISIAIIRAVSTFLGRPLNEARVSELAFEVEKHYHGTPSGIDNTVITYGMPVYYVRDLPPETLRVGRAFNIVIGDSGVKSPTALAVGDLRKRWQADQAFYEGLFDQIAELAQSARQLIEAGHPDMLGILMDQNHALLQTLDISSPELDRLVEAARTAGAIGAKLSGGGRGGNMIALTSPERAEQIARALQGAGAVQTIITTIKATPQTSIGEAYSPQDISK